MAKISSNNILTGTITSDKLDASVVSGLTNANNANVIATTASTLAAAAFVTANTNAAILANTAPIITTIQIADSSYNVLDDTAANTTGGYVVITGSGFVSTPAILFGTTSATAVTYVSSTTLRVQVPALSAASYPVYVVNTNGGTAIKINGLTTSSFPAWSTGATLSNQAANTAFGVNLSATSDSGITYSNTTSLPAGTSLLANGYFSGTVTIGVQTTYTFNVKATDVELQDASRTFSVTVTVGPPPGIWTSGKNDFGQLGQNDRVYRSSPTQVGSGTTWSQISTSQNTTMATKTDGTLWIWGNNLKGNLGLNDQGISRSSPTQVGVLTNWSLVSVGNYSVAAIKTDGTLWRWGQNNYGQLGLNDLIDRSSPVQVGVLTNWSLVSVSGYITTAIKTNGTLWAWGENTFGSLGLNDILFRSSPVQVGSGTTWSKMTNNRTALATKTDGTLWAWGWNARGQCGLGDVTNRSSPVQVGSGTTWSQISNGAGGTGNIATKTDGTLWAWGSNYGAELGLNDTVYRSSPVQVGSGTTWNLISTSQRNTMATKTDGTLWTWGTNSNGGLGQNSIVNRSSPVQVGAASNWSLISMGSYGFIAKTT